MDIQKFPLCMADIPVDLKHPNRTLVHGLFEEFATVGGAKKAFSDLHTEKSGVLSAVSGHSNSVQCEGRGVSGNIWITAVCRRSSAVSSSGFTGRKLE